VSAPAPSTAGHPVAVALRDRPDGARLALVVEGGGMRGAVSGGMALALDELGFGRSFDAAFGSSAGTLNAMWLLSGRVRDGIPTWIDPGLVAELINWRRIAGRRPVVDIGTLVDQRYEQLAPGLFERVLAAPTELHPIATEVGTGEAVDLHSTIRDVTSLRRAIRASATLPLLAGDPVEVDGRRFLDAGLSAAIPFRAAFASGATHVLVLRSRRPGEVVAEQTGVGARLTTRMLRRIGPAVATAFVTRAQREGADEELLAAHDADPALTPHVLSVRPPLDSPVPARLERDIGVVRGALEAGRQALHDALGA
jgi:predicted patatin/cPLA2 family phospholipase